MFCSLCGTRRMPRRRSLELLLFLYIFISCSMRGVKALLFVPIGQHRHHQKFYNNNVYKEMTSFPCMNKQIMRSTLTSRLLLLESVRHDDHGSDDDNLPFSKELISSLDLRDVMQIVASQTGTQRARRALLDLVQAPPLETVTRTRRTDSFMGQGSPDSSSSRQRRVRQSSAAPWSAGNDAGDFTKIKTRLRLPVARNAMEARDLYEQVAQASLILDKENVPFLTLPPIYGHDNGDNDDGKQQPSPPFDPDLRRRSLDDYDDWLDLPLEEWTLEHILQAEQVIQMLLQVREWATSEPIVTWAPLLSREIIGGDETQGDETSIAVDILKPLLDEIAGSVEILRVKTLTDPTGRSSFTFRLSGTKYKVLQLLREKQSVAATSTATKKNKKNSDTTSRAQKDLEEELEEREQSIQHALCLAIFKQRRAIDEALLALARLDAIIAKAAFGLLYPAAAIPDVRQASTSSSSLSSSAIHIPQFLHPLLHRNEAVPIELRLGQDKEAGSAQGRRALILTGSNGGGKTLAMKSFGLVSILAKLGIPIPTTSDKNQSGYPSSSSSAGMNMPRPRVDFFNDVIAAVGDRQNVMKGQSTFMAQLATYSGIIEQVGGGSSRDTQSVQLNVADNNPTEARAVAAAKTTLVLLDELGSGTEENAGGAIAQAILEKLLESPSCHVVATTHSLRLKTLAFESENFDCAAATVHVQPSNPKQVDEDSKSSDSASSSTTLYQLQYGVIGESYALDAASRCTTPPLPEDVLSRAASLLASSSSSSTTMDEGTGTPGSNTANNVEYVRALTASLEQQLEFARESRSRAESIEKDTARCQLAMVSLAMAYDRHLGFLEERVEGCFQKLNEDQEQKQESSSSYTVLGDSLAELRLVRKQVKSESQLLQERGLCRIPHDYKLTKGESVVIIASGEWDGTTAQVVLVADTATPVTTLTQEQQQSLAGLERPLLPDEVAVEISPFDILMPPIDAWDDDNDDDEWSSFGMNGDSSETRSLAIFKRHDLAVWDYSYSMSSSDFVADTVTTTSIPDSKRRLNNLLSSLQSDGNVGRPTDTRSKGPPMKSDGDSKQQHRSSRERRAAAKQANNKKKKRKRR